MLSASACTLGPPPDDVFDFGSIGTAQREKMQSECDYEAKKAVASQKQRPVRHLDWRNIFLKCLELRGAKHLGTTDDFPDL
jgi:hypothetical protein